MKAKKIILIFLSILFTIFLINIPNSSKAETDLSTPLYLGAQEFRKNTTPENMAYAIGTPDKNGSTIESIVGEKIWKFVSYKSIDASDVNYDDQTQYFCAKGGVGFRNTGEKAIYDKSYNFVTDRDIMLQTKNDVLKSILTLDNNVYYNIIALAELLYIPGQSTEEDKQELLDAAKIYIPDEFIVEITDSDIEAIEQAAIWYFTNYDDKVFNTVYNQYGKIPEESTWFTYRTKDTDGFTSLSDYDKVGEKAGYQRQVQAIRIYNYLIKTAMENAEKYKSGELKPTREITIYVNKTITTNQPILKITEIPEFDLSLRKYITKVNGVKLPKESTRIPEIEEGTLKTETTATYKHKKDPVEVKTGDRITYNITIYNEGEKPGRASKIVDQLPTGLKYLQINTQGFTGEYDEETNTLTIKRTEGNEENIPAYKEGKLSKETIEIECEVTAMPEKKDKVLTNVAYIAEEIDGETGETIIEEKGKDRDSEPGTAPEVTKDNMEDYKGQTEETDLSKNIYYKGQQDDDDFEKLILKKAEGNYQVQIKKVDAENREVNLQGAKFKVTLPDGSNNNYTSNEQGIISLPQIEMTKEGKDQITIEETEAPAGYNSIVGTIKVEITKEIENGKYKVSNAEIIESQEETEENKQVVIELDKENNLITITIPNIEKEFDLSLRKYITKINREDLPEESTRIPEIEEGTLKTETTATYKHKKDPVEVKTGDIVTYNITIYNEGEKPGRASKIVDQLPTGLKYLQINTQGFTGEYDEETNTLTIKRAEGNEENLPAYKEGNLSKETIEIECEVTAMPETKDKVLTNVAYIAEEIDGETGETIIEEKGKDRDSEPGTAPEVTKDNMEDYKGQTEETDLSQNIYYKGQQDDDDFEKLILKKAEGNYQVQIKKVDAENKEVNLQGAKFKVTLPDGSNNSYTSNEQGIISLPQIEMTKEGKDQITIEETEAPAGYNSIIGTIKVEITKKIENGKYKVSNAEIIESQEETEENKQVVIELDKENNLITITIPNQKREGMYTVKLIKQDKDNQEIKLEGAVFNISLPDGTSKEYTTNANGEITLPTIEITEEGKDQILIEEIEAPTGYNSIIGTITVSLDKKIEGDKYVIQNAEIVKGQENIEENKRAVIELDKENNLITIKVLNEKKEGAYTLKLVKEDKENPNLKLEGAVFNISLPDGTSKEYTTNKNGEITLPKINITEEGTDEITIEEIKAPNHYFGITGKIKVQITKEAEGAKYIIKNAQITEDTTNNGNTIKLQGDTIQINIPNKAKNFDLKLIKRIVEVNGTTVPERIENVDVSKLNTQDSEGNKITTADYILNKEPVSVKKGDIVKYTIRVYNEGDTAGYAQEISEDVPEGLEFLWSEKTDEELEADETLTEAEKEAIKYNQGIWDIKEINTETGRIEMISTDYLAKGKGEELIEKGANLIKGFDQTKGYINTINEKNPDYKEVSVYMEVVSENQTGTIIRNEAAVTEDADEEGNPVDDRDSSPEEWVKYEDDEDYDNVKLQVFDLSLRKFIIAVSPDEEINEEDYLRNEDGTYSRAPQVDTSTINTIDSEGNMITTAIYNHPKTPVEVNTNDYVIYNLRVYNEGEIAGYAEKITDYLPEELEFVEGEFNNQYGWEVSEDGRKVETNYLQNSIIEGIKTDEEGNIILSYKEVPIMCKVKENTEANKNLTNIAEITEYKDENKNDITDRDSEENNVNLPEDENLPTYKDDETGEYIPGQEDDDDFEKVVIKPFDLALRKFITGVNSEEVGTRIPQVKYDKETNKITYEHTKEPVEVVTGNTVIYTIRVYNEGEKAGFARKVADDIPEGLEFLPENSINQEYRWVMYDSKGNITENVEEAEKIVTDYLSKAHGEEMMEENSLEENPNLLKPFDKEAEITDLNPDYRDIKVAFKVTEPETSDRIVINSAQIEEDEDKNGDEVEDIDSIPGEWNEGEDDQDKEYVKVTYFDLSLRKWVTEAIVIEDGKETITQTGHTAEMDPEPVVKVELHRKKLDEVTVKFRYKIRVTNEGNIAGYAKEITDYVPEGLKFVAEDNPGWTDEGNNIISTRLLENTLLEPGESAEVEVLLTWINGNNNLGLKTNTAEISEDYNDKDVPDIDSTPDNKKPGEDDIDIAEVILSISTGGAKIYYVLGFTVLLTLAAGIVLIKKYVI